MLQKWSNECLFLVNITVYKRLISKVNELLDLKNLGIILNALHTDRITV
jgi:hypothetical protein